MIALAAAAGIAVTMLLSFFRLFSGPTLYDRTLAANGVLAKSALLCAAVAVSAGQPQWIDAAFAFLFAAFGLNVAVLKFFRVRTFQPPLAAAQEQN